MQAGRARSYPTRLQELTVTLLGPGCTWQRIRAGLILYFILYLILMTCTACCLSEPVRRAQHDTD